MGIVISIAISLFVSTFIPTFSNTILIKYLLVIFLRVQCSQLAWIPVLVMFVIILGVGGKQLVDPSPAKLATVLAILGFSANYSWL